MSKRKWVYNVHHRLPRSKGGTDDEENLIRVPSHFHDAWHLLFKNHNPELIARFCNEVWLPKGVEFVVQHKEIVVKGGE